MEKKLTKRQLFAMVEQVFKSVESENKTLMLEFLSHEMELLEKKATSKKETETQKQNAVLKGVVTEVLLVADKGLTVTEVIKADARLADLSNQKVTRLLKQMVESGDAKRIEDGKKATFVLKQSDW